MKIRIAYTPAEAQLAHQTLDVIKAEYPGARIRRSETDTHALVYVTVRTGKSLQD